jgi:hypothetical protein
MSDQALVESLVALEEAAIALASSDADYRMVLGTTLDRLPRGSENPALTEITSFLERAPNPGPDFRCSPDFMLDRARRELRRVKDVLLNLGPRPVEPQVCYTAPVALDMSRAQRALEIYGFDFDQVPLEVFTSSREGFFADVSFALDVHDNHHATLMLGANGPQLARDTDALVVAWGHLVRYSIPVIQRRTPLCDSTIEEVEPGKLISYAPFPIAHDARWSGPEARVLANVALAYESNKIDATMCLTAVSSTNISGCAAEYPHTSQAERSIEHVFGELQAAVVHPLGGRGQESVAGTSEGPAAEWIFEGFDDRGAAQAQPQIAVRLRKIRAVSTPAEGCVSAIRYLEARRQKAVGPATSRRFDPQLRKIDREILNLRARFAPPLTLVDQVSAGRR